jgi:hypothetical protein
LKFIKNVELPHKVEIFQRTKTGKKANAITGKEEPTNAEQDYLGTL